jgi:hypothetical protein
MSWAECGMESGVWWLRWRGVERRQTWGLAFRRRRNFTLGLDRHGEENIRGRSSKGPELEGKFFSSCMDISKSNVISKVLYFILSRHFRSENELSRASIQKIF